MSDKPGTFQKGNAVGFQPGQSGNPGGKRPKPPGFAEKAALAGAWFHGFAAGTANDDAQAALRRALETAWAMGNLAPRDLGEGVSEAQREDVDALMRKFMAEVLSAMMGVQPTKEQLFAAVKVIEWEYGKATASVDVNHQGETRVTKITRVIVDSNTVKMLPAGGADVGRDRKPA